MSSTSIATIGAVAASGIALGAIAAESVPFLAAAGAVAIVSSMFAIPKPKSAQDTTESHKSESEEACSGR